MRYFIGFLIKGEAAEWHNALTKGISEKFGTWKLHEHVPPHVTVYRPFDTGDIEPVKNLLEQWAADTDIRGNISLKGYGRFGNKVVFAKVETDAAIRECLEKLRGEIGALPHIPPEDFPEWHPHATLAHRLSPQEIIRIWEHVSLLPEPDFTLPFDNVTLFRHEGDRWVIEESFYLVK